VVRRGYGSPLTSLDTNQTRDHQHGQTMGSYRFTLLPAGGRIVCALQRPMGFLRTSGSHLGPRSTSQRRRFLDRSPRSPALRPKGRSRGGSEQAEITCRRPDFPHIWARRSRNGPATIQHPARWADSELHTSIMGLGSRRPRRPGGRGVTPTALGKGHSGHRP